MIFFDFDITCTLKSHVCKTCYFCHAVLKSTRLFQTKAIIIKKLKNSGRCGVEEEVPHKEFQTVLYMLIRLLLILPWSDILMDTPLLLNL